VPKLTQQQTEALEALDWLLDPGGDTGVRGSGRTTVLALAYLRHAFNRVYGRRPPGDWIPVVDHHHIMGSASIYDNRWVLRKIEEIAHQARLHVQVSEGRFRVLPIDPTQEEDLDFSRRFLFEEFVVDGPDEPGVPRPTSWEVILSEDPPV
jgi:hypothetical protein